MKLRCLLLLMLAAPFAWAQMPFDCATALEVCDGADVTIDFATAFGSVLEDVAAPCVLDPPYDVDLENGVVWLKYTFTGAGDFLFTLTPEDPVTDLDFIVFRSPTDDCQGLTPLRCMFSGENVGQGGDEACLGVTGLAASSSDTTEGPGCSLNDDNFLAPVAVAAGDVLYLAVLSFNLDNHYTVSHGGDATIGCPSTATVSATEPAIRVYPNPLPPGERLHLDAPGASPETWTVTVFDALGRPAWSRLHARPPFDLSALPPGLYWLRLMDGGRWVATERVVRR